MHLAKERTLLLHEVKKKLMNEKTCCINRKKKKKTGAIFHKILTLYVRKGKLSLRAMLV